MASKVSAVCDHFFCSWLCWGLSGIVNFWKRHSPNVVAVIFMVTGLLLNTIMISLTHERVPMQMPVLPDLLFDFTSYAYYSFTFSEVYIALQNIVFFLLLIFHPEREIIIRRFMLIMGVVYFLRTITYTSTQLPSPFAVGACLPKMSNNISLVGFTSEVIYRAYNYSFSFGFVSQQQYFMCGDYIFSGHTSIILVVHLFINTYFFISEDKSRLLEFIEYVHLCLTTSAILCVFVSRQHYSVDVALAYYITTRLFWTYHSLCLDRVMSQELRRRYEEQFADFRENDLSMKQVMAKALMTRGDEKNLMSQVWWWPIFVYLEIIRRPPDTNASESSSPEESSKISFCFRSCRSSAISPNNPKDANSSAKVNEQKSINV